MKKEYRLILKANIKQIHVQRNKGFLSSVPVFEKQEAKCEFRLAI